MWRRRTRLAGQPDEVAVEAEANRPNKPGDKVWMGPAEDAAEDAAEAEGSQPAVVAAETKAGRPVVVVAEDKTG